MYRRLAVPHTYVIVFTLIVLAAALTWILPGGEFERELIDVNGTNRSVIVQDSYHAAEKAPQSWQVFSALFDGFCGKADIIVFILIIGGAFWIMNDSKAIDVGIQAFLSRVRRLEKRGFFRFLGVDNLIIVFIMLIFSVFGATFGMSEETIAFIIIFVPLAISMGYDSIVGLSMCFVGAGLGFAGALLNPFTIGIAQGLSSLPLFSGIEYRLFVWLVINAVGMAWVLRYARRIRKNPRSSPVYESDLYWRNKGSSDPGLLERKASPSAWISYIVLLAAMLVFAYRDPLTSLRIGTRLYSFYYLPAVAVLFALSSPFLLLRSVHYYILNLLLFTIVYLIIGVMAYGWFVKEIASLFFAMGIFSGIAMNRSANQITRLFVAGMKDILSAAVVVGLAGGILVILEDGRVIDSMLYQVASSMQTFGKLASVSMMYAIQTMINIFIPSGSAKAALTMPIMSQFSDLIGVSRQATVMAFQFGDGFTNMITPTSPVLIGVLGVARIPYEKWFRWSWPFMLILILLGWLLLIPTVTIPLNGF
ncbi:MAG: short-chain fatty acid transporter [Bacteroidetes bacterium]|nr:MAG: short-chain fatty acid transporter [Bacteroidota bacterium]